METAKANEGANTAVVVGDLVGAVGIGDVDLDDDEIGSVVEGERLNMLVDDDSVVVGREVGGERCQAERREE